jgi:AAA domain
MTDKNLHVIRSDKPLPLPPKESPSANANRAADDEAPECDAGERPFNGKTSHAKPSRIRLIRFDDLKPGTESEYLVKGLIPRAGLVVVWGPPKCGKSFWTMDALLHVALGWKYRGRAVQGGAVVYCAFEGQSGYGKRAEAFRLRNLSAHTDPVPFHLVAAPMNFGAEYRELINAIRLALGNDIKPVAVALDTLNRSLVGSESDDKDMAAYLRAADAVRDIFDCAVIIVHHCGVDASRPRGHTSLTGAVDAQLAVKRDSAGHVIVQAEWMKDGEEGDKVACRFEVVEVATDSNGQPITSCVMVPADDVPAAALAKPARMPKTAQTALKALKEAIAECGEAAPASNHIPADVKVTTIERWRIYAYKCGISAGEDRAKQKAFKSAFDHLNGSGEVAVWDNHVWPTR